MAVGLIVRARRSLPALNGSAVGDVAAAVAGAASAEDGEDGDNAPASSGAIKNEKIISGTPGSPSAAASIDGRQLPAPDPKFGGVIKDGALQSKAWWAPRVVPPKGAPNILLIMTDEVGYGALAAKLKF